MRADKGRLHFQSWSLCVRLTENVTFVPNDDSFLLMPLKTNFKAENGRERKREREIERERGKMPRG